MFRIGEIGQWAGMGVTIAGLVVEGATGANIGYIILTAGSLAWAIFTKVKYYRGRKRHHHAYRHRMRS